MSEPERWLTSPDAPGPMKDMLSAAQKVGPSTLERAALAGKLGVATSGLWLAPVLKGLAGVALVAGGVWVAATANAPAQQTHRSAPPHSEQLGPESSEKPLNIEPSLKIDDKPSDAAPMAVEDEAPFVKNRVLKAEASPEIKKPSEASLIAAARNSLETAPAATLGRLAEHAKLYPSGVLAEEREVLRIRALKSLGRAKDAAIQEQKFHKQHPESVHHVP